MRRSIVVILISAIVSSLIYWIGIASPRKEMLFKTEMVEMADSGEVSPCYMVFYKWDGIEQKDPWWILLKINGEWKVARLKDVIIQKSKEDAQKSFVKFDTKWINGYGFSPQSTRYQLMLLFLGAQPVYSDETSIFHTILHRIKEYEKQR